MRTGSGPLRLVIAGGGTGGHVFPGIAVAEALAGLVPLQVMWIGTGRPVEADALKGRGWDHRVLMVRPLAGRGISERLFSLACLPLAIARAMKMLHAFRPHAVFSVGGYVAGPIMVAARLMKIPCALHEQNVTPGMTNRLSGRFADMVFVSFEQTGKAFPGRRVRCSGNPVRREILDAADMEPKGGRRRAGEYRILVLGGSQGARGINTVVSSALLLLWNSGVKIRVVHQSGSEGVEQLRTAYREAGLGAEVRSFISSVGRRLAWADLVIARAGAGTVSELAAVGKASVLIPYPHAAAGHQEFNAREFARAGAAVYFREEDIGAVKLSAAIQELLDDKDRLWNMALNARRMAKLDAAGIIARDLLGLCGFESGAEKRGCGTRDCSECGKSADNGVVNVQKAAYSFCGDRGNRHEWPCPGPLGS